MVRENLYKKSTLFINFLKVKNIIAGRKFSIDELKSQTHMKGKNWELKDRVRNSFRTQPKGKKGHLPLLGSRVECFGAPGLRPTGQLKPKSVGFGELCGESNLRGARGEGRGRQGSLFITRAVGGVRPGAHSCDSAGC